MQSYNSDGKLFETLLGDLKDLERRKEELLTSGKAAKVVIGKMPEPGVELEINGLMYTVFSRTDGGTVVLKLNKP